MTRFQWYYENVIRSDFLSQYGNDLENIHQVPKIIQVTIHSSISQENIKGNISRTDNKLLIHYAALQLLTNQRPLITRCKTPVAAFHIRKKDALGCKVTLQGKAMFDLLEELITIVWPRNTRQEFQPLLFNSNSITSKALDSSSLTNFQINTSFQNPLLWPRLENHYTLFPQSILPGFQMTIQLQAMNRFYAVALCNALQIPCR